MTSQPIYPPAAPGPLFHIAHAPDWAAAAAKGRYRPPAFDREGFVHLSTAAQVPGVAEAFYRGATDLVLLAIDPGRLPPGTLRWEAPRAPLPGQPDPAPAGALFPHAYCEIPVAAVAAVHPFAPDADGRFRLPASVTAAAARSP